MDDPPPPYSVSDSEFALNFDDLSTAASIVPPSPLRHFPSHAQELSNYGSSFSQGSHIKTVQQDTSMNPESTGQSRATTGVVETPLLQNAAIQRILPPPPRLTPCNFISGSQTSKSISGRWLIKPSIRTPERRGQYNVSLHNMSGSVRAEIFILWDANGGHNAAGREGCFEQLRINLTTMSGSVIAQIRDVAYATTNSSCHEILTRPPLHISAQSQSGNVKVFVPRSFHGLICVQAMTLRGPGAFAIGAVETSFTYLESKDGYLRGFLARNNSELPIWNEGCSSYDDWQGDRLEMVTMSGGVGISYTDD